jgi:hypothetical protein
VWLPDEWLLGHSEQLKIADTVSWPEEIHKLFLLFLLEAGSKQSHCLTSTPTSSQQKVLRPVMKCFTFSLMQLFPG